jgi:murein DD-endopeptidase MepM/ murein hydrolase activator NlpD
MIAVLRVAGIGAVAAAVWLVAASQVPSHARLPIERVVVGAVVTQPFGCTTLTLEPFDPFCPSRHIHTGIDLAAPTGTDVHAATAGIASVGFDAAGAGLYVLVHVDDHVRIFYCHLSRLLVKAGDPVTPGEVIGLVGSTGRATGPHVHFEIQVDRVAVDPAVWLAASP